MQQPAPERLAVPMSERSWHACEQQGTTPHRAHRVAVRNRCVREGQPGAGAVARLEINVGVESAITPYLCAGYLLPCASIGSLVQGWFFFLPKLLAKLRRERAL